MVRKGIEFVLSYPAPLANFVPGVHHTVHAMAVGLLPSITDFRIAFVLLVLPQVPLTLGNAMLATKDCAQKYFGPKGDRVTLSRLAISMGLADLVSGIFSGMPICHGAGGMTAHYRLGAKTGVASIIIGSLLLIFGILSRNSAMILAMMPAAVIGALLAYVGIRHALLAQESFADPAMAVVMIFSAAAGWFTSNLLIPLTVGFIAHFVLLNLLRLGRRAERIANG